MTRTAGDIIASLRFRAQENEQGDLMLAAADELERLRSLLNESTARWASLGHDCYTTHYMLPEGGCGVYLDGFRDKGRRDEIRREAGLPELLQPEAPTQEDLDAKVEAARAARAKNAQRSGPADFPLVGDPKPVVPASEGWKLLVPEAGAITRGQPVRARSNEVGEDAPLATQLAARGMDSVRRIAVAGMQAIDRAVDTLLGAGIAIDRIARWTEAGTTTCGLMVNCPQGADSIEGYKACTVTTKLEEDGRVTVETKWHRPFEKLAYK